MARAYSVFANQGRSVTPIAIRTIEDRNGRVVFDVERDARQRQRRSPQVVSPQNAYIMTRIMEKVVDEGSLSIGAGWGSKFVYRDDKGTYKLPVAGKTGTTQNWSDAWVVGYSPYYTAAVWFGFDRPGNSLGVELTGATLAGPVWGDFFREIHRGLPRRSFSRPNSGVIDITVCSKSGLLRTSACNEGEVTLPFLEGTTPGQYCDLHGGPTSTYRPLVTSTMYGFDNEFLNTLSMPKLDWSLFPELQQTPQTQNNRNTNNRQTNRNRNTSNPFLDDTLPSSNSNSNDIPASPDAIINFVPGKDDDEFDDSGFDGLPSWNPLL
jgi:penicillin-binding protein 1A